MSTARNGSALKGWHLVAGEVEKTEMAIQFASTTKFGNGESMALQFATRVGNRELPEL